MTFNWKELLVSKIFWTCIGSIASALVAAKSGGITWAQAAQLILTAVSALWIKDALVSQTKEIKA